MSVFGNILLITGIPGIGKTTVIKKAIKKIPDTHIEGFYTEEIRSHNARQGFVILPLSLNGMGSILSVRKPALKKDDQGVVEFKATSFSQKKIWRLHEVSRFVKEEGQWFYVIGDIKGETSPVKKPPRVGRNEPCSCGSGKKFKKCCGS